MGPCSQPGGAREIQGRYGGAGRCARLNVDDTARRGAQRAAHVGRPELQLLVADRRGERLQAQPQSDIRRRRSSSVLDGVARSGGGGGGGGGGVVAAAHAMSWAQLQGFAQSVTLLRKSFDLHNLASLSAMLVGTQPEARRAPTLPSSRRSGAASCSSSCSSSWASSSSWA